MDDGRVGTKIFQTWKTKDGRPENYAYWRATIVRKNPDFAHVLWDDHDNRRFFADLFSWFLPTYDSFPAEIYRADCTRSFYLHVNGGLYIDLDSECLTPLRKYIDDPGVLLGRMGPYPEFTHAIANAILGSRPKRNSGCC
jgi:mannosyltransferase OCH1-like enzyme